MARRTRPADASNPLTKVGHQVGGVAHSALGRGACSFYEAWLYSQRLGIKDNMSEESPTPWSSMETSLNPPAIPVPQSRPPLGKGQNSGL